jgi:CheY-like chemotaxis protein
MKLRKIILLVDDDPAILALLGVGLEDEGFLVVKAQSTSEALQRVKDFGRIDVLATDVVLPGALKIATHYLQAPPKHGIELMRVLLAQHPDLRVVLFSGQPNEMLARTGGIPPGTVFLRKPLNAETLARAVRQVLAAPEIKRRGSAAARSGPSRPAVSPVQRTATGLLHSLRSRLFGS